MANYYQKVNSEWKKLTLRGITGKGVKVAGLDTGNNNNPDVSVNFTTDPLFDLNGHGSITGSIVKSSIGLAKDCILYNFKVVNDAGIPLEGSIVSALQYCRANGISIVWMSFYISQSSAIQTEIDLCNAAGIVLLASSGNSFTLANIVFPAGANGVYAVNSLDVNGVVGHKNGLVGSLSHGIDICCNGVQCEGLDKNGTLITTSGTSFSDCWAAGALALTIEMLNYCTPKEAINYILRRADKQTDTVLYGKGKFIF